LKTICIEKIKWQFIIDLETYSNVERCEAKSPFQRKTNKKSLPKIKLCSALSKSTNPSLKTLNPSSNSKSASQNTFASPTVQVKLLKTNPKNLSL